MEPQRNTNATLVDLLDRILDKGLVIYADLIVSVAGIPLIGVNLRAALAGMETMLKYGVMQAWDEKSRLWETEHRKKQEISFETCPQCGRTASIKELLEQGCPRCEWISPKLVVISH